MNLGGVLRPKKIKQASLCIHPAIPNGTAVFIFVFGLLAFSWAYPCLGAPKQQAESRPDFSELLHKLGEYSPDPCGPPIRREADSDDSNLELHVFEQAAKSVERELNAASVSQQAAVEKTRETLKKLEQTGAEINAKWPQEARFHFEVLDLPPILVLKTSIRARTTFFAFGVPEEKRPGEGSRVWQRIGSEEESREYNWPPSSIDLYPLHRGPSGRARFLAKLIYSGCAGSIGVAYDAREWDPKGIGSLDSIIRQSGAFGLDDKVLGFEQIGELRTEGSLVTLPYCWFSRIDTWDNPSLCAVDTYDLSGDTVRFRSHTYNRPDLLPIAKAVEFAQQRDYPALLGYCASSSLALRLIRDLPPYVFAEDVRVTRTGNGKEHVELAYGNFDVEKRNGRWVVVSFSSN